MKGNVIGFDPDTNTGAISGHDGIRYDFATLNWLGQRRPRHGDQVDFQPEGTRATQIHLIEPEYVTPGFWRFYFSPSGRISRSQYWLKFVLPYLAITVILQIAALISGPGSPASAIVTTILCVFWLAALWPSIAVLVKRIHDRNKSGWFILFLFVPAVVFSVLLFVWLGAAIIAAAAGQPVTAAISLGIVGILVIGLGTIILGINIWFFVEFGCLRGTIGANRFGADPTH
jgi:uncharacterized membrane protein YhaH (DUF805 family)